MDGPSPAPAVVFGVGTPAKAARPEAKPAKADPHRRTASARRGVDVLHLRRPGPPGPARQRVHPRRLGGGQDGAAAVAGPVRRDRQSGDRWGGDAMSTTDPDVTGVIPNVTGWPLAALGDPGVAAAVEELLKLVHRRDEPDAAVCAFGNYVPGQPSPPANHRRTRP